MCSPVAVRLRIGDENEVQHGSDGTRTRALPPRSGYERALRVSLSRTFNEHAHERDGILVGKSLLVDK
jgi:hypothetical protein